MFQWQLKYFSASETGSHICDPRLPRLGRVKMKFDIIFSDIMTDPATS